MAASHWLVKTEPGSYSWSDLVGEGETVWDGVRNHQARNNLRDMKRGDLVLVYHSGSRREVVGIARVVREAYPDPTADDPRWLAVDLKPVEPLAQPVPLAAVRAEPRLSDVALLKNSRLSVMPLPAPAYAHIVSLAEAQT